MLEEVDTDRNRRDTEPHGIDPCQYSRDTRLLHNLPLFGPSLYEFDPTTSGARPTSVEESLQRRKTRENSTRAGFAQVGGGAAGCVDGPLLGEPSGGGVPGEVEGGLACGVVGVAEVRFRS